MISDRTSWNCNHRICWSVYEFDSQHADDIQRYSSPRLIDIDSPEILRYRSSENWLSPPSDLHRCLVAIRMEATCFIAVLRRECTHVLACQGGRLRAFKASTLHFDDNRARAAAETRKPSSRSDYHLRRRYRGFATASTGEPRNSAWRSHALSTWMY